MNKSGLESLWFKTARKESYGGVSKKDWIESVLEARVLLPIIDTGKLQQVRNEIQQVAEKLGGDSGLTQKEWVPNGMVYGDLFYRDGWTRDEYRLDPVRYQSSWYRNSIHIKFNDPTGELSWVEESIKKRIMDTQKAFSTIKGIKKVKRGKVWSKKNSQVSISFDVEADIKYLSVDPKAFLKSMQLKEIVYIAAHFRIGMGKEQGLSKTADKHQQYAGVNTKPMADRAPGREMNAYFSDMGDMILEWWPYYDFQRDGVEYVVDRRGVMAIVPMERGDIMVGLKKNYTAFVGGHEKKFTQYDSLYTIMLWIYKQVRRMRL